MALQENDIPAQGGRPDRKSIVQCRTGKVRQGLGSARESSCSWGLPVEASEVSFYIDGMVGFGGPGELEWNGGHWVWE